MSESEWVWLLEVHVPKGVVDHPVVGLVRPDGEDDVPHHGALPQLPVVDRDLWGGEAGPHGKLAGVQLVQDVSVGHHGLLLKVADKPVTEVRGDHVEETEGSCEDELSSNHTSSKQGSRSAQRQEGHQVHPLILSLLYQGVNPAVVSLHPSKKSWHQMLSI